MTAIQAWLVILGMLVAILLTVRWLATSNYWNDASPDPFAVVVRRTFRAWTARRFGIHNDGTGSSEGRPQ
jgi:hypothetical protein